jgi:NAD(P)-dependent dehydrogenase (short-subunit alcohol dehydrogenase family)
VTFSGRVILVTGASRGIGRAAAIGLAKRGAHVLAVARTIESLEHLDDEIQGSEEIRRAGGAATLVPLDLTDFAGIDRLPSAIVERWGKLDGLFGNAGILGPLTPLTHLQLRAWDDLLAINLTANLRLLRALDPLLRKSDAGRVLFVSSGAAHFNRPYWGGYAITKAALEVLAFTYAAESNGANIKVNVLNPGPTRTRMRAQAFPGEDPQSLPAPEELAPLIAELLSPECQRNSELVNFER